MDNEQCDAVRNLIDFARQCIEQDIAPNNYVEPASYVESWCDQAEHYLDCKFNDNEGTKCHHKNI